MVQKIISNILRVRPRHFWRSASFSEVAELYAARLMRTIAVNVGAAFMSVYMLKSGYSVAQVSLFWAAYFGFKVVIVLPLSQVIAYIGAKKAIILSNFLYIPSMIAFIFLPEFGLWALTIAAAFQSTSAALYDMGYLINFSRVKSVENAGRQVAFMNIAEKVAKGVSPLIGGLLAMLIDPRASIAASIIFFLLAAWPMMRTKDTMTTGFRLHPKNFPWSMARRSIFMQFSIGFDTYASGSAWSLFLASLIFTASGNQVYAELGALTSLILLVSLASTHMYGKLIDKRAGGQLLRWAAAGTVLVNIFRALTRTPAMAIGTNAVNEVTGTGYYMPFMRGMFDVADRSRFRVFYIGMSQLMANAGAAIASLVLAIAVTLADISGGFTIFYLATALAVSLIMLSRFRVYGEA